jgi:hypothetical protein
VAVRRDLRAGEPVLDETWWKWRRDGAPARGRQRGTAVLLTTAEQPLRVGPERPRCFGPKRKKTPYSM